MNVFYETGFKHDCIEVVVCSEKLIKQELHIISTEKAMRAARALVRIIPTHACLDEESDCIHSET